MHHDDGPGVEALRVVGPDPVIYGHALEQAISGVERVSHAEDGCGRGGPERREVLLESIGCSIITRRPACTIIVRRADVALSPVAMRFPRPRSHVVPQEPACR
jgi:hypothetical protein